MSPQVPPKPQLSQQDLSPAEPQETQRPRKMGKTCALVDAMGQDVAGHHGELADLKKELEKEQYRWLAGADIGSEPGAGW